MGANQKETIEWVHLLHIIFYLGYMITSLKSFALSFPHISKTSI